MVQEFSNSNGHLLPQVLQDKYGVKTAEEARALDLPTYSEGGPIKDNYWNELQVNLIFHKMVALLQPVKHESVVLQRAMPIMEKLRIATNKSMHELMPELSNLSINNNDENEQIELVRFHNLFNQVYGVVSDSCFFLGKLMQLDVDKCYKHMLDRIDAESDHLHNMRLYYNQRVASLPVEQQNGDIHIMSTLDALNAERWQLIEEGKQGGGNLLVYETDIPYVDDIFNEDNIAGGPTLTYDKAEPLQTRLVFPKDPKDQSYLVSAG